MEFKDLNVAEAVAILENIKHKEKFNYNELFSQKAQEKLISLENQIKRNDDDINSLISGLYSNNENIEIFMLHIFTKRNGDTCNSIFNTILNSYTLFEQFCNFFRDYLNTKKEINNKLTKK